jgi:polysaccharide deacetylase 2 family uncharacterized protein YibQ
VEHWVGVSLHRRLQCSRACSKWVCTLLKISRGLIALAAWTCSSLQAAEIAVVIDDVGYSITLGMRAINLPGPVSLAVFPFAPNTKLLAHRAIVSGKDIILHQPMQPHAAPHVRIEDGTLTLDMAQREFDDMLSAALDAVPASIGLSNHTGSLLTQHREPMERLMQSLCKRGLFFLDSRTTSETIALDVARELGVPAVKRDVFLDHDPRPKSIDAAFERALRLARQNGHALIIAHPYSVSLSYLETHLAALPEDIQLVPVRTLTRRAVAVPPQNRDDLRISLAP